MKWVALRRRRLRLSTLDLAIVGGAGVAFVAGFLPWWSVQFDLLPGPFTTVGGSAGFTAWLGVLLLTAAGVPPLLRRAGVSWPSNALGPSLLVFGASALGLLLVFLRWLTLPSSSLAHFVWTRYGLYLALIAGAVEVVAALVELRISGEPLPWSGPGDADAHRTKHVSLPRTGSRARLAVAFLILGSAFAGAVTLHGLHTGPPTCARCLAPNLFSHSRPQWADPAALALCVVGVALATSLLRAARSRTAA